MAASDELMDNLAAAVDALCAADPADVADGESVVALHRQLDRLEAVTTRASAAFDARRSWDDDGARSAAAWISVRCNQPMPTARQRVRLGRDLRHMGVAEAAWVAGDIGGAHVERLAKARTPVTAGCFARDESLLVSRAVSLPVVPRRGVGPHRRGHRGQGLEEDRTRAVRHRLERSRGPGGRGVSTGDLARTPAQRRADALVEMARRAGAVAHDARLPAPLFTILVAYETFAGRTCELAEGTAVTPGSLVPWLAEGWVERVVFDGPSEPPVATTTAAATDEPRRRHDGGGTLAAVIETLT